MCGFLIDCDGHWQETAFLAAGNALSHRGPDHSQYHRADQGQMLFHRLAIMGPGEQGHQPFYADEVSLVCNGEIYNHQALREALPAQHRPSSDSDCAVLIPAYRHWGLEGLLQRLDGEFALVLFDHRSQTWVAARDPVGIRPLFMAEGPDGQLCFASEAKGLSGLSDWQVSAFPPGHALQRGNDSQHRLWHYHDASQAHRPTIRRRDQALSQIRKTMTEAVCKRLDADAPLGALLSGGLDSSLVCAIAQAELDRPLPTFATGLVDAPIDLPFAAQAAEWIGTDHHSVQFTLEQVFEHLEQLIWHLETFDITTIRASIGMYLVCQHIRQATPVRALLTGELSDEVFGYPYTDFAPSARAFAEEARKRVREVYAYDVLRADRCIAGHGLEARVPFADKDFLSVAMAIQPGLKLNRTGMGKALLREAFAGTGLLSDELLYRDKAAFSDAVGHGVVDTLKLEAERRYSDADLRAAQARYLHAAPISKEALWYREIFEQHFPERAELIPGFWMPNPRWQGCQVNDPSARALSNYALDRQTRAASEQAA
jgi:asparagine synthase (glutamine-hydrolysing)